MSERFEDPRELMGAWAQAVTDGEPRRVEAVFADDAEFVNLFGSVWQSRAEIVDGHAWALRGPLQGSTMRFEHVEVRELGDEVVVMRGVCERGRREDASAETLPAGTTVLMIVAERGADGWRAVAGANVARGDGGA